jgi:hypothetical protein
VGAAIIVGLFVVVGYALLVGGGPGKGRESQIRAYYSSLPGGGAPDDEAKLIHVSDCNRVGPPGEFFIVKCALEYRGRTFSSCFAFDHDHLVAERDARDEPGCEHETVWSRDANTLVSR